MKYLDAAALTGMVPWFLHIDIDHADILEFVFAERQELPWVKRCVNVTQDRWNNTNPETKEAILEELQEGTFGSTK